MNRTTDLYHEDNLHSLMDNHMDMLQIEFIMDLICMELLIYSRLTIRIITKATIRNLILMVDIQLKTEKRGYSDT